MRCKSKQKGKVKSYAKGGNLSKACWKGYKAVGFKKKGGRTVPKCVNK